MGADSNRQLGLQDYPLILKAGVPQRLDVEGNYLCVVDAVAQVQLAFNDSQPILRYAGTGGPRPQYRKVLVSSLVDQDVTISLGYSDGGPYDGRPLTVQTLNVLPSIGTSLLTAGDASVPANSQQLVLAAKPGRFELILQLDDAAPGFVRYGDSSVSAIRGIKIYPGDINVITTKAAVFVFNPNGAAATYRATENLL